MWVGNFDHRPLVRSSSVTGAGPIFHAVMLAAEQRVAGSLPRDDEPATTASAARTSLHRICALAGMAAMPWCPTRLDEWTADAAPLAEYSWHRLAPRGIVVDWLAEYQAWARAEHVAGPVVPRAVETRSVRSPANPPSTAVVVK